MDELTRAYNRRYFDRRMVEEMTARMRSGGPLSLIVFDIDRFKSVNDEFGHVAGDAVLREVATIAATHLRASEVLCRYGGEEFAVIVNDAPLHSAVVVAERLRNAIGTTVIEEIGRPVTISAGVAQWDAETDTVKSLVGRADEALYEAKRNGRDRVQVRNDSREPQRTAAFARRLAVVR
jgi:diguanylate cyclase (GGDEF)-like protein